MKGYLARKGVHAVETRIGAVLRTFHQPYHEARCQVANVTVSVLTFCIMKLLKCMCSLYETANYEIGYYQAKVSFILHINLTWTIFINIDKNM